MRKGYFITGTDTGVGKTTLTVILMKLLAQRGFTTAALKPIATGCFMQDAMQYNEDALLLQAAATCKFPYSAINPVAFVPPIAPAIAADLVNQTIALEQLLVACQPILNSDADYIFVEGTGGWKQPLNRHETLADFARVIQFPIIMVVGIRLGCINHALLTAECIQREGLTIAAWIANGIDPSLEFAERAIALIQDYLPVPCLGSVPHVNRSELISNPTAMAADLAIDVII